jgi:hypothetical protein
VSMAFAMGQLRPSKRGAPLLREGEEEGVGGGVLTGRNGAGRRLRQGRWQSEVAGGVDSWTRRSRRHRPVARARDQRAGTEAGQSLRVVAAGLQSVAVRGGDSVGYSLTHYQLVFASVSTSISRVQECCTSLGCVPASCDEWVSSGLSPRSWRAHRVACKPCRAWSPG